MGNIGHVPTDQAGPEMHSLWRKKPVVITAHQLGSDGWPDEIWQGVIDNKIILHMDQEPKHAIIHTLEGDHRADLGDFIIRGVAGEFYPCKPEIFATTYERADLAAPSAPAEVEGLALPELYGACRRCMDNGNHEEAGQRLEYLRHDGEMWSCESCWDPEESGQWADAPQAATALTAQQAEIERLRTSGIAEIAAVNSNVMDYMRHWEARAEKAEAERDAWKANADAFAKECEAIRGDCASWCSPAFAAHAKLKREV